jgi:hypothetical protein
MYENGNSYFSCVVWERIWCLGRCEYYYGSSGDDTCRYCRDDHCNNWSPSCERPNGIGCETEVSYFSIGPECPPDYSKWAGEYSDVATYGNSVEWTLKDDKKDNFWGDLFTEIGIEEKDIAFKDVQRRLCSPSDEGEDACTKTEFDYNFPVTEDYEIDDVLNPKDVVEDVYKNLQGFVKDLPGAVEQMRDNMYNGHPMDLVDAIAVPIFMVEQAVDAIQQIADTVDEWDRKKRENIILLFLSAIFFFVPVLGQLTGTIAVDDAVDVERGRARHADGDEYARHVPGRGQRPAGYLRVGARAAGRFRRRADCPRRYARPRHGRSRHQEAR